MSLTSQARSCPFSNSLLCKLQILRMTGHSLTVMHGALLETVMNFKNSSSSSPKTSRHAIQSHGGTLGKLNTPISVN